MRHDFEWRITDGVDYRFHECKQMNLNLNAFVPLIWVFFSRLSGSNSVNRRKKEWFVSFISINFCNKCLFLFLLIHLSICIVRSCNRFPITWITFISSTHLLWQNTFQTLALCTPVLVKYNNSERIIAWWTFNSSNCIEHQSARK